MHMYGTFQVQSTGRGILYVSIPGFNTSQGLAGKSYGPVILEECSTETIFTDIGLQDRGLCMVIVG